MLAIGGIAVHPSVLRMTLPARVLRAAFIVLAMTASLGPKIIRADEADKLAASARDTSDVWGQYADDPSLWATSRIHKLQGDGAEVWQLDKGSVQQTLQLEFWLIHQNIAHQILFLKPFSNSVQCLLPFSILH